MLSLDSKPFKVDVDPSVVPHMGGLQVPPFCMTILMMDVFLILTYESTIRIAVPDCPGNLDDCVPSAASAESGGYHRRC